MTKKDEKKEKSNASLVNDIQIFAAELENYLDSEIDFLGELKRLKDMIEKTMKSLRSDIEKKSNGPFRHGEKWVIEWTELPAKKTLDKNAMKSDLGETVFEKYETLGKTSTMMKIKPLINTGDNDE